MPATEWILVVSIASSIVIGGRMEGSREASMLLPEPGRADHQHVVAAGGRDFQRGFGGVLPFDVRKVQRACGRFRAQPLLGEGHRGKLLAAVRWL